MKVFLEGPASTGKTTLAIQQLEAWLQAGIDPHQMLILVPQRALGRPYQRFLDESTLPNAASVQVVTLNGLAQRALALFWTGVAPQAIPNWDGRDPTFLTIETAQYYMATFVKPRLESGLFDGLSLPRSRLVAQILDNLAKASNNGIALSNVPERLSAAWVGHSSRLRLYQVAAQVAQEFREFCLEHALLDFSLQMELYIHHLIRQESYAQYVRDHHRYIIIENAEENYPVAIDYYAALLDDVDEAVVVYDTDAGLRLFLGADPKSAAGLSAKCDQVETVTEPINQSPEVRGLVTALENVFLPDGGQRITDVNPLSALTTEIRPFYPEMIDWIVENVIQLVESGVEPGEIVILAPFLNDSLRFTIFNRLEAAGVPYVSHRPSRAIRDEPVARSVLTLMALVYGYAPPQKGDVARALNEAIHDLDPIRADLLAQVIYKDGELGSFDRINQHMQSRITYVIGEKYEALRLWLLGLKEQSAQMPPDHFMQRLFEYLAHISYGFHANLDAGRIVSEMIDSARRFREVVNPDGVPIEDWGTVAAEYAELVGDGVLAALHYTEFHKEEQNAVFVAPAYTFLMRNRVVDYQFWVDAGSGSWGERLDQPLTHPYVLRRDYPASQVWTDDQEVEAQEAVIKRLLLGLTRRCRRHVYLGFADLGESGFEQRGQLLRIFNAIMGTYV